MPEPTPIVNAAVGLCSFAYVVWFQRRRLKHSWARIAITDAVFLAAVAAAAYSLDALLGAVRA